jgi:large subunit ribosomal protein L18
MASNLKKATSARKAARVHRKTRIKAHGTLECPRMNVFRSDKHIIVQLIDDDKGNTIIQCSTMNKDFRDLKPNLEGAKKLGKAIAEASVSQNIKKVVFDRNGYKYHGVIKALADAAREAGLKF